MEISQEDIQSIVNSVLSSVRTNSRTIDQLSLITTLADEDCLEVSGGKRISYAYLKEVIRALLSGDFDDMQTAVSKLRQDFDALIGKNASNAIDNFNEICAFLEGIEDSETLLGKLAELRLDCETADTALGERIDSVEDRISPILYCSGFISYDQTPSSDGTFLQKDSDGDPIQIVTKIGSTIKREVPDEGMLYICDGKAYVFNGIMLILSGHSYFIFDGGKAHSQYGYGEKIGGGNAATDTTIMKRINCGGARFV